MSPLSTLEFNIARGATPDAELIFTSIDASGSPGELNRSVLRHLGLGDDSLPTSAELADGYAVRQLPTSKLVFIVTVDGNPVDENLRRNLRAALRALDTRSVKSLWIPLMGTGAGRLGVLQSLGATLDALVANGGRWQAGTKITLSLPHNLSNAELNALELAFRRRGGVLPGQDTGHLQISPSSSGPAPDAGFEERYSDDVLAVMKLANLLASRRRVPSEKMSTSLLVFAMASRSFEKVWGQLAEPAPVRLFSQALRTLAGSGFDKAWHDYFDEAAASRPLGSEPAGRPLSLTRNVQRWLKLANDRSLAAGRDRISLADMIEALFLLSDGGFAGRLTAMGISLPQLVAEYRRRAGADPSISPEAHIIHQYFLHDRATSEDQMDFEQYAFAIANFLLSAETAGPISISIQAPWGGGKSSLMQQVRAILDPAYAEEKRIGHATTREVVEFLNQKHADSTPGAPARQWNAGAKPGHWTVWFNAWKYESSEQVWAGLVDAVVSQVSDRLDPVERELFLLRLNLARIDDNEVRKKIYGKMATYWWAGARWLLAIAIALPSAITWLTDFDFAEASIGTLGGLGAGLTVWLGKTWTKVMSEPSTFSLAQYVRVPEYGKSLGVVHHIHQDLQRIISVLPKGFLGDARLPVTLPLVIFVDDLDRCAPSKVASIVEGINTFLAGDQREFMFVIGMDPQIVAAALEHAHKDLKSQLPRYEQGAPLGWRFMDKFVQLAFTIPPRRTAAIEKFVGFLTRPRQAPDAAPRDESGTEGPEVTAPAPPEQGPGQEDAGLEAKDLQATLSKTVTNESKDVHEVMVGIIKEFHCSPREIKRILNFVRFVLLLRVGRIARSEPVPGLPSYQRWIILCVRWPELVRWLQWGSGTSTTPAATAALEGPTAQRLAVLESATANTGQDVTAWAESAANQLGLPGKDVAWLSDPELHRFFLGESQRQPVDRLSQGASIGFY